MSMTDWARHEVELACKREAPDRNEGEWDYGCFCYESALKAYESLVNDNHSGMSWNITKNILIRLMEDKPLTPIEDVPEVWNDVTYGRNDGAKTYQCNRILSLFKYVYPDGTVKYNDVQRYYCLDNDSNIPYTGGGASDILNKMFPITMPYSPKDKPYVFRCGTFLTDRKNGDFDTKAYYTVTDPDGNEIVISRYFAEVNGKWEEIPYNEFLKRVHKHNTRERIEKRKKEA